MKKIVILLVFVSGLLFAGTFHFPDRETALNKAYEKFATEVESKYINQLVTLKEVINDTMYKRLENKVIYFFVTDMDFGKQEENYLNNKETYNLLLKDEVFKKYLILKGYSYESHYIKVKSKRSYDNLVSYIKTKVDECMGKNNTLDVCELKYNHYLANYTVVSDDIYNQLYFEETELQDVEIDSFEKDVPVIRFYIK